jgi:hypothetical protein
VSMDKCMFAARPALGPRICQASTSESALLYQPFAQPLLGLILMADLAQGLDASKLILAETVRFF